MFSGLSPDPWSAWKDVHNCLDQPCNFQTAVPLSVNVFRSQSKKSGDGERKKKGSSKGKGGKKSFSGKGKKSFGGKSKKGGGKGGKKGRKK